MMDFSREQLERYSRHILLADVGVEGQARLAGARVLVVGAGGLGAPVCLYLAAAGVGTVGVVDADRVELSNLQRQICHFTHNVGDAKADSAREKMLAINPEIEAKVHYDYLRADNALDIIGGYDFVVEGTDNFPAKFLVNDACVMRKVPFCHGGILRFRGQAMTVVPGESACYRCVFTSPPPPDAVPSCSQAGVLGAVAGMLGAIQAAEALKFITGAGDLLTDALLTFDAKTMNFRKVPVTCREDCPVCGDDPELDRLVDHEQGGCAVRTAGAAAC